MRPISMIRTGAALSLLALGLGASCSGKGSKEGPGTAPDPAPAVQRPRPTARIVAVTDLQGTLEPCGCTSRPLGGIDKLAAQVERLRQDGVPTAFVAAGNLLFDGVDHGAGHSGKAGDGLPTQELWKAETLASILGTIGLDAGTLGPVDHRVGQEKLPDLAQTVAAPLLDVGTEAAKASLIHKVGPITMGIVGVTFLEGRDGDILRRKVREETERLRSEGKVQVVLALAAGSRREINRLSQVAGIDFVIAGGIDEEDPFAPKGGDAGTILHAGRNGQRLLVLDLFTRGDGPYRDWSDWTVDETRRHLEDQIRELEGRIAAWTADPKTNPKDVAAQRVRLQGLQRELKNTRVPPSVSGNAFNASLVELAPDRPKAPAISSRMRTYDQKVNTHNKQAYADVMPPPAAEGDPHYVGSAACAAGCHDSQYAWWKRTKHGRAYETLESLNKEYNLSCVGCHVTGYGEPGGSTVTHNLEGALVDVGCEVCHGPGSQHIETPDKAGLMTLDPQETRCITCHNEEHSDKFDFRVYRALMIAPGHGQPKKDKKP